MSQPERIETLVLGSGASGKVVAWQMAESGHRYAVVERKLIGGSWPNTNCLSSKNEIWSAKAADQAPSPESTQSYPTLFGSVQIQVN